MKEKMQKVKTFVKEHNTEILDYTEKLALGLICSGIGWYFAKKAYYEPDGYIVKDEPVKGWLAKVYESYPTGTLVHCGMVMQNSSPIALSELGKFGELLKDAGAPDNETFTHILAVGPEK